MAKIHIVGICGTFMGGLARIAVGLGHEVSGSDENTYPPMSTQLANLGVNITSGYDNTASDDIDIYIIGNALSRGNALVEDILNKGLLYTSGPQWLADNVLKHKWVLAVSGTHGKTTTASMLIWILEYCGYQPSYLIGGVCQNFDYSARINDAPFFVIEADEYDSAFFDKRSKMVHYLPRTLIINNLEFDHADIFKDLESIQTQFHHMIRTVPNIGQIIYPQQDDNIRTVLNRGCWSETATIGDDADWSWQLDQTDGSQFRLKHINFESDLVLKWGLIGLHNVANATSAIAAAYHVGVLPKYALAALKEFTGVKRRLEKLAEINGITIYDDFAHHPTAIKTTLEGLRLKVNQKRIVVILDLASNTMKSGYHQKTIPDALKKADVVVIKFPAELEWHFDAQWLKKKSVVLKHNSEEILEYVMSNLHSQDQIVIMSNSGFEGIHQKIINRIAKEYHHEK